MCNCPYTLCFFCGNLRLTKWLQRLMWCVKIMELKKVWNRSYGTNVFTFPPAFFICSIYKEECRSARLIIFLLRFFLRLCVVLNQFTNQCETWRRGTISSVSVRSIYLVLITTLHKFRMVFGMHQTAIFATMWPTVYLERYDLLEKQVWAHGKAICLSYFQMTSKMLIPSRP